MPYYSYNIIKDLYYNSYNFKINEQEEISNEDLEQRVLDKYIKDDTSGLEIPDILTNVNGAHVYKLISSKDIDWENIYLPNSAVSSWASFDPARRWNTDTPIHVNDVYELLNIIDYLLCSCADLWSEINKLKYGNGNEIEIWFLKDTSSIIKDSAIEKNINKNPNNNGIRITFLDPTKENVKLDIPDFAIGTTFYPEGSTPDAYPIKRLLVKKGNKNGIQGITRESQNDYQYDKSQTITINGEVKTIYGYRINNGANEIKFFPGFNFDNFIGSNKVYKGDEVVDTNNKKLKYNNVYFRPDTTKNEYARIYCEFLTVDSRNGYILYYKDENNINQIIYISSEIAGSLPTKIQNYSSFSILPANNMQSGHTYEENNKVYPWFFICNDEFTIDLTIETPKIEGKFEAADSTITLYYYKQTNNINTTIYIEDNINNPIKKSTDLTQTSSYLTNKQRYNIPDNIDINIKIDAIYINNNDEINYDDEYMDYPVFPDDITTSEDLNEYYIYDNVTDDKREFKLLSTDPGFINNVGNRFNDVNSNNVVQLYKKNEQPYKLTYEITPNEFIVQDIEYTNVKNEINNVKNNIRLHQDEDNAYILTLNHSLNDEYEQIKFDLNLEIEETSKVKGTTCKLPINLNKVHNPKLHYINWQDTSYEYNSYFNFDVYEGDNLIEERFHELPDSKMFRLCHNFSINSYMANGIYNVDTDYTFTDEELESNTNENPIIISYHPTKSIVNLIGSNMTIAYLYNKNKKGHNNYSNYANSYISDCFTYNNSQSIYNYLNDKYYDLTKKNEQSLFNIYNLGKKYRFNSNNDKYVHLSGNNNQQKLPIMYNINANSSNRNSTDNDIKLDNIAYFLNFKICNDNSLTKSYYISNNEYKNDYEYFDNDIYTVKTDLFDIYKTTYATYYATSNNDNVAVFSPILYMDIINSSFIPINSNNLPSDNETHQYDLTNNSDKQKYKNYIESWANSNENSALKTTYFNLKLQENLDKGIPFFNETNETTTYFKVKRCTDTNIIKPPTIVGDFVRLLINKEYYLTDLLKITPHTDDKYNSCCIGSYPEWNDTKNEYMIKEINSQRNKETIMNQPSGDLYEYINFKDDYSNYIDNQVGAIIDNFIPEKYKNIYNFSKIFEVNKLSIQNGYPQIPNENDINGGYIYNDDYFEYNDLGLFKLKENSKDLLSFEANNNEKIKPIPLDIKISKIYGNLRYGDQPYTTSTPSIYIIPIYRIKTDESVENSDIFIEIDDLQIQLLNFDESKTYYEKKTDANQNITYEKIEKPVITISGTILNPEISIPENFDIKLKQYKASIITAFKDNNLYTEEMIPH